MSERYGVCDVDTGWAVVDLHDGARTIVVCVEEKYAVAHAARLNEQEPKRAEAVECWALVFGAGIHCGHVHASRDMAASWQSFLKGARIARVRIEEIPE